MAAHTVPEGQGRLGCPGGGGHGARVGIRGRELMATKPATANTEETATREETSDGPLMDTMGIAVKRMLQRGKERGYITYDELNQALPPDQMSSEQIEDVMTALSEMGVNVRSLIPASIMSAGFSDTDFSAHPPMP